MMQDLKISEKLEGILISKGQKMHTSFEFASCVVCRNYVEQNITISQITFSCEIFGCSYK